MMKRLQDFSLYVKDHYPAVSCLAVIGKKHFHKSDSSSCLSKVVKEVVMAVV